MNDEFEVRSKNGIFNLYHNGLFLMELPLWVNDYVENHNENITLPDLEELGMLDGDGKDSDDEFELSLS